jgi:hypothetical protein
MDIDWNCTNRFHYDVVVINALVSKLVTSGILTHLLSTSLNIHTADMVSPSASKPAALRCGIHIISVY